MLEFIAQIDATPAGLGVLLTGLLLGIRHGIDWDHIAAITDITSTPAAASAAEAAHAHDHEAATGHRHGHGGTTEIEAHGTAPVLLPGPTTGGAAVVGATLGHRWIGTEQGEAIRLGTLYAG